MGHDLGCREVQVVVRFFAVADSVASVGDVYGLVRKHLDVLSVENTVLLLGQHVRDSGFLGVEVVADLFHSVGLLSFLHHRLALNDSVLVFCTSGVKDAGIEVIFHVVRGELHVSVCDGYITIVIYKSLAVAEIFYNGVLCCCECRSLKGTLPEKVH